jgi:hypothetical protein
VPSLPAALSVPAASGLSGVERVRTGADGHVALVELVGYGSLIESLELPDCDDRHVLAAAITSGAQVIVATTRKISRPRSCRRGTLRQSVRHHFPAAKESDQLGGGARPHPARGFHRGVHTVPVADATRSAALFPRVRFSSAYCVVPACNRPVSPAIGDNVPSGALG